MTDSLTSALFSTVATAAAFLQPYEFSPTVLGVCLLAAGIYFRGLRRLNRKAGWDTLLFALGLVSIYLVLQTQIDYYGRFSFFMHRTQHLVLHHLGPFLIAVSAPASVLLAGLPNYMIRIMITFRGRYPAITRPIRMIQAPFVSGLLFVAIIYFWLIPGIHFDAMLSMPLYNAMNWGMAIDGLMFWWMIFRQPPAGMLETRHYGVRLLVLFLVMFPQILLGAYIALSPTDLYPIYALCGRVLPLNLLQEQALGGLVTWIPAAMMSVLGALVLLVRWSQSSKMDTTTPIVPEPAAQHTTHPMADPYTTT